MFDYRRVSLELPSGDCLNISNPNNSVNIGRELDSFKVTIHTSAAPMWMPVTFAELRTPIFLGDGLWHSATLTPLKLNILWIYGRRIHTLRPLQKCLLQWRPPLLWEEAPVCRDTACMLGRWKKKNMEYSWYLWYRKLCNIWHMSKLVSWYSHTNQEKNNPYGYKSVTICFTIFSRAESWGSKHGITTCSDMDHGRAIVLSHRWTCPFANLSHGIYHWITINLWQFNIAIEHGHLMIMNFPTKKWWPSTVTAKHSRHPIKSH